MIRKAVIPAAGFGTRFLPATKAQPKEMLPIVDKPVIQYLVEEAVASGIEEIIIVTGRGKRAIEDHFDHSWELEHTLVEKGKDALLEEVRAIERLAKFVYVRQPKPLGDGHAILCAKEIVGNEPFLVLFGDDIVDSTVPVARQLIDVFEKTKSPVLALQEVNPKQVSAYGIVEPKNFSKKNKTFELINMVEKPVPKDAPSNLAIVGKYVCTPNIFEILEKCQRGKDGEIRLIDGFLSMLKQNKKIFGHIFEGKRYDTGDKLGLLEANIDFALKRDDLAASLKEFLKRLDLN